MALAASPPLPAAAPSLGRTVCKMRPVGTLLVRLALRFQPSAFIKVRSLALISFTTPELEKASKLLLVTELAQSPESPPVLVLRLPRLVAPLLTER